jgi:hypothetical protein
MIHPQQKGLPSIEESGDDASFVISSSTPTYLVFLNASGTGKKFDRISACRTFSRIIEGLLLTFSPNWLVTLG